MSAENSAAARQSVEAGGDLPGARHPDDLDIGRRDAVGQQRSLGAGEETIHHRAVETRRDDAESPPGAVQGKAVRNPRVHD